MPSPFATIARLKVVGTIQGQDYNNVMHFGSNNTVPDLAALNQLLQDLCLAMLTCFTANLSAFTSDFTVLHCEAVQIWPGPTDPVVVTAPPGSVGEAGPTSVSFASTLVQVRTGVGGRKGRGRINLPPPDEANAQDSIIQAAGEAEFAQWVACVVGKFIGLAGSEAWELGVLSQKDLTANPSDVNAAFRPATSLVLKKDIARMGSRKRGSGN